MWLRPPGCDLPYVTAVMDGRRVRLALTGSVGVAAVVAAGIALREVSPPVDRWVVDHLHAAPGTAAAEVATAVSGAGTLLCLGLVLVGAAAVWLRHRSQVAGLLWRAALLGVVCGSTLVLEGLVQRAGPPQQPEASTFPSGHATVVTAAVLTALVLWAPLGRAWLRGAVAAGGTAALLVCASRVVLAEHWLVDVVAGVVATAAVGLVAAAVLRIGPGAPATTAGAVRVE
jgi:undecaprenyl-diphosphatase